MTQTLYEVNEFIRRVVALNLQEALWVRCELADVKVSRGHFYLDLVQKAEDGNEVVAQAQAVIWQPTHRSLLKKLGRQLDSLLQPGLEVLMLAKPEFHEKYGLKYVLEDIDPSYTLGKLEMQRREAVQKLQALGLLEKNRSLQLPPVLQRIAVLASPQSAGYQDFTKQLTDNQWGYTFELTLFPTAVQGALVASEVATQLDRVARMRGAFDVAVIIRGGGAKLDLAAFDSFELGKAVAAMPLPVLSGIGHEVDETVLDLVSHTALKTPTAVAEFVLHRNMQFEAAALDAARWVQLQAASWLQSQAARLVQLAQSVGYQSKSTIRQQALMLDFIEKEIPAQVRLRFFKATVQLDGIEKNIELLSPATALRRGFGLVFSNGKAVTSTGSLQPGDTVEVRLHDGRFSSTVLKIMSDEQTEADRDL